MSNMEAPPPEALRASTPPQGGGKKRRERPKAIKLSEAAAARIRDIMANADGKVQGVRVGVTNGGCAGMSYTMDYADAPQAFEEVVEDQGVKVFIDPKAIMFLIGTEMDFVREKLGSRFVFNNPNQTAACGCGESVTLKPAETAS
jgi:iron-sulfur cluster assembly protein